MKNKYNRLRQGYEKVNPKHKQYWLNIKSNVPFDKAYEYILNEDSIQEVKHICDFLQKFKYATHRQINRYLELGNFSIYAINLDRLVEYGFFNSFFIGEKEAIEFTKDEIFYSIGQNACLLLRKVFNMPVSRMLISEISAIPINIINRFDLIDFYLNYVESHSYEKLSIELNPIKRLGYDIINVDAEIIVKINGVTKQYLILNSSSSTVNTLLPKTIFKLERLLLTDKAEYYFINDGINTELIILCENEDILNYTARKLAVTTFAKNNKLNLLPIDYLLRTNLSEYNIAYSVDEEGNTIEKAFA